MKIPVNLSVLTTPPLIGSIVNHASRMSGAIVPGEIVAIRGPGAGPAKVLFDGAPGRVLSTASNQTMVVTDTGVSPAWGMPVAPLGPGVFSVDGTGTGQAAVLNWDNTANAPSNPVTRESVIQIFGTGEKLTPLPPVRVSIGGVPCRDGLTLAIQ